MNKATLLLLLGGAAMTSAVSILLFPKLMEYVWIASFVNWDYSYKAMGIFMLYLNILVALINIFFKGFNLFSFSMST